MSQWKQNRSRESAFTARFTPEELAELRAALATTSEPTVSDALLALARDALRVKGE